MTRKQYQKIMKAEKWRKNGRSINSIPVIYGWIDYQEGNIFAFCRCGLLHRHSIKLSYCQDNHRRPHCRLRGYNRRGYYIQLRPGPVPDEVTAAAAAWSRVMLNSDYKKTPAELLQKARAKFETVGV